MGKIKFAKYLSNKRLEKSESNTEHKINSAKEIAYKQQTDRTEPEKNTYRRFMKIQ